jgi:hypothetical protein
MLFNLSLNPDSWTQLETGISIANAIPSRAVKIAIFIQRGDGDGDGADDFVVIGEVVDDEGVPDVTLWIAPFRIIESGLGMSRQSGNAYFVRAAIAG